MEEGRRRLAAILAADIAGYSRLVGMDEEGVIADLRRLRAEIVEPHLAAFNGRIANTAGDSFLIEFQSAVDAVRAALAIQGDIARANVDVPQDRRLELRIGINVGDVLAEGADLLGDGVNVAARLEALAPAGGICIARSVRDQVLDRLQIRLEDLGEIEVKNIARPVHAFLVHRNAGRAMARPRWRRRLRRWFWPVVVCGLVAALGLTFYRFEEAARQGAAVQASIEAGRASVAVLPFLGAEEGASGDRRDIFAEGVAEDIGTELARLPGLTVTAPDAARRSATQSVGVRDAGEALGVAAVLTGSVRRADGRVRVTARLIDVATGAQLWAERYDRADADLFQVQDDVARQVARAVAGELEEDTAPPPRAHTPDIRAYDAYVLGRAKRIPPTPSNLEAALRLFEQAIEFDGVFAGGYAGASFVHSLMAHLPTTDLAPDIHIAEALRLAETAVSLDPGFGPAHGAQAEALVRARRHAEAIEAIKAAVRLAPNDSLMHAHYGRLLGYIGKPEEGADRTRQALRMSPDSPPPLFFLGANQRLAGDFEGAIVTLEEHRERLGGRLALEPNLQLAAAYAQAGEVAKARTLTAEIVETYPAATVAFAERVNPFLLPEDRDAFLAALRRAGLPEAE